MRLKLVDDEFTNVPVSDSRSTIAPFYCIRTLVLIVCHSEIMRVQLTRSLYRERKLVPFLFILLGVVYTYAKIHVRARLTCAVDSCDGNSGGASIWTPGGLRVTPWITNAAESELSDEQQLVMDLLLNILTSAYFGSIS